MKYYAIVSDCPFRKLWLSLRRTTNFRCPSLSLSELPNGQSPSRLSFLFFGREHPVARWSVLTSTQWERKVKQRGRSFIAFLDSCIPARRTHSIERQSGAKAANFPRIPQNKVWSSQTAMHRVFVVQQSKWYLIQSRIFFIPSHDIPFFVICRYFRRYLIKNTNTWEKFNRKFAKQEYLIFRNAKIFNAMRYVRRYICVFFNIFKIFEKVERTERGERIHFQNGLHCTFNITFFHFNSM